MVSEHLVFGEGTTGPQDDLDRVTRLARQMVTQWGMSEHLGPRTFGRKEEMVFLGREISEQRNYSEKVAEEIDDEVRRIVEQAYETSRKVLTENRDKLENVVKVLLDEETIEGEPLKAILDAPPGKESEELIKAEKKTKPSETADESSGKPPVKKPKSEPGLAWETQSRLGRDKTS
jgi:cell division protease FtsH